MKLTWEEALKILSKKRKKGRPKKSESDLLSRARTLVQEKKKSLKKRIKKDKPKKPRGRPRKHPETKDKPKKPRGRPRKHPIKKKKPRRKLKYKNHKKEK